MARDRAIPRPSPRTIPAPEPAGVGGRAPLRSSRRRLLLAAVAIVPAGCGFQLRGSAELPFETLYASFPANSPTGAEFRRLLRVQGGTRLVDQPSQAQARLEVLDELREKEIVGFSSSGRPREYQLRLILRYRLLDGRSGAEITPRAEILLRREITTTDTQVVAKEREEALLYREMQTDMVQQLLRRLAAARPQRA
jgi:LPS-assembly lipoprotein